MSPPSVGSLAGRREIETPAYVFDEAALLANLAALDELAGRAGLVTLYSLKAACRLELLELIGPRVGGFSVSSLFETRLAKSVATETQRIHLVSPRIRAAEIRELAGCRGSLSFNSLEQWRRLAAECPPSLEIGLRVNPGLTLVDDDRYDPCRPHSKLGVPLSQLRAALDAGDGPIASLAGLHVHTNCEARSYDGLLETVCRLVAAVPDLLAGLRWINLGGGYLFAEAADSAGLLRAVELLRSQSRCAIHFEPGAGLVQTAAYLVAEVVDLFERDGLRVAVLDASVCHWPEVFEYKFQPDLEGDLEDGRCEYLVAGCSCLAGDVFGRYAFAEPLAVGSRVAFLRAGAYSMVKESYFNGLGLPGVYWLGRDGTLTRTRHLGYDDFVARNGAPRHALG